MKLQSVRQPGSSLEYKLHFEERASRSGQYFIGKRGCTDDGRLLDEIMDTTFRETCGVFYICICKNLPTSEIG